MATIRQQPSSLTGNVSYAICATNEQQKTQANHTGFTNETPPLRAKKFNGPKLTTGDPSIALPEARRPERLENSRVQQSSTLHLASTSTLVRLEVFSHQDFSNSAGADIGRFIHGTVLGPSKRLSASLIISTAFLLKP